MAEQTRNGATSRGLMALEEALQRLLAQAEPVAEVEEVPTASAAGRVLARDLVAALDVPGFDNSQVDGYAVRCDDVARALAAGQALPVAQRIPAGHFGAHLAPGTVARIFTGAPLPDGADAVVMQEEVALAPAPETGADQGAALGWVRFGAVPRPGQCVRRRGEDVRAASVVLPAGTRLSAAHLGLAASIGCATLPVFRRLRVALAATGDELVQPGECPPQQLPPGAIYNSNRYFLEPLLQRLGCAVTVLGRIPDDRQATQAALAEAARTHDVIVTTGGVSVGEEDHIKPVVQAMGALDLWQIAMKPGKPFAHGWIDRERLGARGRCHLIGLPGNPVSSFVTFVLLARALLLRLAGAAVAPTLPAALPLTAHFEVTRPDKRREFLRVRRNAAGGLDLFPNQNSSVLTSMAWADGLVDKPAGGTIAHGDTVRYLPLWALLD
ncbi:molybdopterin molybdotransferase MoeA [Tepidimonas charontis]|uniref:Molybdopterin molybdenumtransferase n=1 Tax=Tepidimonas charontis TaxID=2267262 RepID=A0A554XEF2_9BURK|nr:gephyrin-like molybdotransferase Glp [Tepidimonas charontis]TSE34221.1 Molybdopterin molybdenumtransferase [Tepidimonas charontis]